jgi:hypothetical protein
MAWLRPGQAARERSGLWHYLTERSRHRAEVALEQERNRATRQVLTSVRPGWKFLEYEVGGRLRAVEAPAPPTSPSSQLDRREEDDSLR